MNRETTHTHHGSSGHTTRQRCTCTRRIGPEDHRVSCPLLRAFYTSSGPLQHRGPYQVMEKTDSIYVIEDLVSGKRTMTHIRNLRPFYDPAYTSPLTVAQHNEQEFTVESIIGHHGSRNRRSSLQFKVRNLWQLGAMMNVDKLHDYLRANTMKTLIPKEHK